MAIFSRSKRVEDDGDVATFEQDSELDLPVKPASRPSAAGPAPAVPSRPGAMPPPGPAENRASNSRGNASRPVEIKPMEGKTVAEIARPVRHGT